MSQLHLICGDPWSQPSAGGPRGSTSGPLPQPFSSSRDLTASRDGFFVPSRAPLPAARSPSLRVPAGGRGLKSAPLRRGSPPGWSQAWRSTGGGPGTRPFCRSRPRHRRPSSTTWATRGRPRRTKPPTSCCRSRWTSWRGLRRSAKPGSSSSAAPSTTPARTASTATSCPLW